MLLVLVNTSGGREILKGLKENEVDTVVMLPSVYDAARYGIDDVIAGSMKEKRIRKVISENSINAVIDALNDNESEASFAVSRICKEKEIPLFKYLPFEMDYSAYKSVMLFDKVHDIVDILNSDSEKTLMFGEAVGIKKIAEPVLDKRKLYTVVLKGSEMDVDFSVNSCIPLANVIPASSMDGIADISHVVKFYGITRLVCYENLSVLNRIKIAEELGIEILIAKKETPEYYTPVATVEEIVQLAKKIEDGLKQGQDEPEAENQSDILSEEADKTADDDEFAENEASADSDEEINAEGDAAADLDFENSESVEAFDTEKNNAEADGVVSEPESEEASKAEKETSEYGGNVENSEHESPEASNKHGSESKVVNPDGTINMRELVKCVRKELNIED